MRFRIAVGTLLGVVLVFGMGAQAAGGQDVAGALRGRLIGSDSQPVAGAEAIASSASLQQPLTVPSDSRGRFRLLSLPIGVYQVRVRAIGYRPTRYEGVVVSLGKTTDLSDIVLERQVVELPEMVVRARPASIDPTTAASGTTVRAEEFDALPINRSFRSVVALVPAADYQPPYLNSSTSSQGINIAGGSVWDNAYFVDGVNVTDPLSASSGTNLPYNFLQAVEVKTGGYEAEYGRALGGIVNMITPSGGNTFEGEAFTFVSDHRLRTGARFSRNAPSLDSYTQFDIGLSLSGPIRKDRLWFFAAYNPIVDSRTASFPGMSPARDREVQHRFAGKLTWQPLPATWIVLTGTGDPGWHDGVTSGNGLAAPVRVLNPDAVLARFHAGGGSVSLHATQALHSGLLLEGMLSRSSFFYADLPQTELGATAPNFVDLLTLTGSGGYGGSGREHLGRTSLQVSSTLVAGLHTLKAGFQYENNTLVERADAGHDSIGGYILGIDDSSYVWNRLQSDAHVGNRVFSLYAQDSWEAFPRLRFNAGLRWEQQNWVGANGAHMQTIGNEFSPRLGFVFSPGRPGIQKIFGSAGRFYEQVPLAALSVLYGSGGYALTFYPQDPRVDTTGGQLIAGGPFGGVRRVNGLRGQYYDEATLGYERLLNNSWKVTLLGRYRILRSVIEDTQLADDTFIVGNPGHGAMGLFPSPTHRYRAVELAVERAGSSRWHLRGSYVLSRNSGNYTGLFDGVGQPPNASTQFDSRDSLVISDGLLPNDRTHVVKLMGSYQTGFGLAVGTYASWESGTPLSDLGFNGSNLLFRRPRGSAGRTPSLWDLNLRLDYRIPGVVLRGATSRIILDLEHVGSPRRPVVVDQLHYTDVDSLGQPTDPNPHYGKVDLYQPPMSMRLGVVMGF